MLLRASARGHGDHGLTRAMLAAAAVLATAACARAQTAAPEAGGCAQYETGFPRLAGLTEAEAIAAVEKMPEIRTVRVGGPNTPMTRDHRPDRATVLLRDGKVERVTCG